MAPTTTPLVTSGGAMGAGASSSSSAATEDDQGRRQAARWIVPRRPVPVRTDPTWLPRRFLDFTSFRVETRIFNYIPPPPNRAYVPILWN